MASEFLMPRLSETSDTGTIAGWLAAPGEKVEKGQVMLLVETDKAMVEIEAPETATLLQVFFTEGQVVQAQAVLALLGAEGEAVPDIDPLHHLRIPQADQRPARSIERAGNQHQAAGEANISPMARRQAEELGIDLTGIQGSGPYGRIMKADVLRAAGERVAPGATNHPAILIPMSPMRIAIARNMRSSVQTAPHAFVETEIDVTALEDLKRTAGANYTALFIKAAASALRAHPRLNASLREEHIYLWDEVNIGVAAALDDGLIVPVIRGADRLPLAEIEQTLKALLEKARGGTLSTAEYAGGTFTVSNLGMYGADSVLSIINQGQAGILSIGRIRQRPAVFEDQVCIRAMVRMTLTFDHRIVDGALAGRFMGHLEELLSRACLD